MRIRKNKKIFIEVQIFIEMFLIQNEKQKIDKNICKNKIFVAIFDFLEINPNY